MFIPVRRRFLFPFRETRVKQSVSACAAAAAVLVVGLAVDSASAQLRPLVIKDARVMTGTGQVLPKTSIKISGSTIAEVRPDIKTGLLTRKIKAEGKTVTPGLIDCWSALGLDCGGLGGPDTTERATDAFDRYAKVHTLEALSHGVTAVFVSPPSADGIRGMGSVVRLTPHGALADRLLEAEAALCAAVGVSEGVTPLARVRAVQELRTKFRKAKEHREAKEDYEEELEEYEKKLKERKEQEEKKQEGEDDQEQEGGDKPDKKSPGADDDKDNGEEKDAEAKDSKKDGEEIKKPAEPPRDPESDLLLRVLDGELVLRIEAHRPEDILNVLRVAEEFRIKVVLVGASGGHLVAEDIARAEVPVIVGQTVRTAQFEDTAHRHHAPDNAAKLASAGVEVYVSSGGERAATRFLALNAALAAGHGLDRQMALESITSGAAKLLGIDDRVGRIRPGMEADLVIWDGDPGSPDARVDKVLVGGVVVYDASKDDLLAAMK